MIEVFESDEEFSSFEEEFEEAPEELPKASQGTVTRELYNRAQSCSQSTGLPVSRHLSALMFGLCLFCPDKLSGAPDALTPPWCAHFPTDILLCEPRRCDNARNVRPPRRVCALRAPHILPGQNKHGTNINAPEILFQAPSCMYCAKIT